MTKGMLQKVRKNPDYIEAVRVLKEAGLEFVLEAPRGKGHPILRIGPVRWPISSSPRSRMRVANVRTHLRQRLRAAGLLPDPATML
jgi:hypothetical protein